ncbi:AAA family ATPase [[Mycobacterium] crassicus]|uniref:AAA family ATPase n=1 Tax=[Mycobacterium] crassicus TaxID=2872309 RepID=A0ABU5XFG2_9MYCO|nr:AAA family ATPase [Mycolicibacter sp. MYC098]MEB3021004.1 AAA family ATPase [Mycolicibacter sp. MYC098]
MRIEQLILRAYGRCRDVTLDIGDGVTVVLGVNEAGKSTSLDALSDFLWGIPKNSSRASEFTRSQLRIDALIALNDERRTVVRKSSGLFAEDLVTEIPPPWNPGDQLSEPWWRTRLGFNHVDLRRGGGEVFAGLGDLADIIFAAREGHSARGVLREISDEADKLFKPDGRAKKVQLRIAVEEYNRAVADRDSRLTRAGAVIDQRKVVQELETKHRHLRDAAVATSQALKLAEENRRVIAGVLSLGQAARELDAIDGPRLSPSELLDYDEAGAACRDAGERTTKLDNEIKSKSSAIDALSVDDGLLDDRATFNRLHPDVKVRIEDLRRAGEEFGVAAAEATGHLHALLGSIGIGAVDDLDAAVAGARVRDDHAAVLDELADRIEDLERQRRTVRDERDRALTELVAKGFTVDIATSTAPDADAVGKLRQALIQARKVETKAQTLLAEATEAVQVLQSSVSGPHAGAELTHDTVTELRGSRDAQWRTIRCSWVSGELPDTAERVDIAAEFDARSATADNVADDEAVERARVAALDARAEMQVQGLEAARQKRSDAATYLQAVAEDCCRVQREWAAAWTELGVVNVPDVDHSSAIVELLSTVHVAHARERSTAEQLAEVNDRWCVAAEPVGLSAATTTAAWRRRTQVLQEIETVAAKRAKEQQRETKARGNWECFMAEAVELLQRHELVDGGQAMPATIEQGFAKLGRQIDAAIAAEAKRATYLEQITEMRTEREEVAQAQQDALAALQRLTDIHAVTGEQDLAVLAERARQASDPLKQQAESKAAIKNGLEPGSDLQDVIDRLAGHDEVTVAQVVKDTDTRDQEARQAADDVLSEWTSARDRLRELEESAGAADAEAAVASQQAEVARLAEAWAMLALQRRLLEDVLAGLGAGDTRPLLDHAGKLLEELTEGRWVALRAEYDGTAPKLRVIRADNEPFQPGQLSEGTADQVFFALRLAGVAALHIERVTAGEPALPLVLDDVLMAFDEVRVRGALKILTSLAPGLQIIVFTHHRHVVEAAVELGGITVSRLPEAASIADVLDSDLVRAQASRPTG